MWEIYDELIELIPEDLIIKEFLAGVNWFLVDTGNTGMAMTPREGMREISISGKVAGMKAKEAAKLIKSWNNYEAALGLAVINSVINKPEKIEEISGFPLSEQVKVSVFEHMKETLKGKKVGLSTPMTPHLYKYGVNMLAGTVVTERDKVWGLLKEAGSHNFFNNGSLMVKISNNSI